MFYSNLIYLLIALFLAFKLIKKEYDLFSVYVFLVPFHSWFYNIGLNLFMSQIVNLLMILLIPYLIKKNNTGLVFGTKFLILFLLYAFLSTLIISGFFIDDFQKLGGFFRSEGRFLAQLFQLLLSFSIVPLAFFYIKDFNKIIKLIRIYLFALTILSVLGIVQYMVYNLSGFDMFPLSINEYGDVRSGLYSYETVNFFRMSSLGGEPKGFSMSLIVGFFIIQIFNKYKITFFKYDAFLKFLFLIVALATVSTSAIVLFFILIVVYIFFQDTYVNKSKSGLRRNTIYYIIFFIACFVVFSNYSDVVSRIVEERVFERDITNEDYDAPILIFLSKFPEYLFFGSGLGNIHNLAYPYIPLEFSHYMKDNIFTSKSGYLKIISELGFIGFFLFVSIFFNVYKKLSKLKIQKNYHLNNYVHAMRLILILVLVAYFARTYLQIELIFILALCNVLASSKWIVLINRTDYNFRAINFNKEI